MKLEDVPLDGLGLIFPLLSPYDIGRLWCTGSQQLQWALKTGRALLKFDFEYDLLHLFRFPSLVSQLSSLEHFSVSFYNVMFPPRRITLNIPTLPRNLRFLELNLNGAFTAFKDQLDSHPSRFSNLRTLRLREYEKQTLESIDLRPLDALEILSICGPWNDVPSFNSVLLPNRLVDLTLVVPIVNDAWVSSLPVSLKRLDLFCSACSAFFHLLPAFLSDFKFRVTSFKQGAENWLDQWDALPRGLISFDINSLSRVTPDMVLLLPQSLLSLSVSTRYDEGLTDNEYIALWKAVPPNLKNMLGNLLWPRVLSVSLAQELPRSLCQTIESCTTLEAVPYLPSGTKAFTLPSNDKFDDFTDVTLPPGLLKFRIKIESQKDLCAIPPTVTELSVLGKCKTWDREMASFFPEKLQYLTYQTPNPNESAEMWAYLPRSLDSLTLKGSDSTKSQKQLTLEKSSAETLPPFLRTLDLQDIKTAPDFYASLPRTLTLLYLTIHELHWTSYQTICEFPLISFLAINSTVPPASWRPVISTISNTIRSFRWSNSSLRDRWKTDLENSDLAHLPRRMTNLFLPRSPKVTQEYLKELSSFLSVSLGARRN